jgi:hypothetical protein
MGGVTESTPLQPPETVTEASQAENFVLMDAWVWHDTSFAAGGHTRATGGAGVTVNVAVQVLFASHWVVTVQVTVVAPPQASGGTGIEGLVVMFV